MSEDLVSEALRRAMAVRRPPTDLIVYFDQGSQYTATRFNDLIVQNRALQRMNRRGNYHDNALPDTAHAEFFWNHFKTGSLDSGASRD